jgi:4-hydroxy-2-oxoheptanedioate aldolase
MKMRSSRVLKKLRAGEIVSCFNVHFDYQSSDIASMAGYDCMWVDNEHTARDYVDIREHIMTGKLNDVDVMVRVPRGSYSDYIKPLELDATGIMVPHIMSAEDARKVIRMTRFHPEGRRPVDGGNTDGAYAAIPYREYIRQANKERFVVLQIEDPEAMDELDEIAALDGFDMLFFGPGDFSHSIGAPGEWNHPRLLEARRRVAEAAKKHGKFAGIPASLQSMEEMIDLGYQFLALGADVIALHDYTNQMINRFRELTEK